MEHVHEVVKGEYRIRIFPDDDPTSPREWDTLTTMFCFHPRYTLGDAEYPDDEYRQAEQAYDYLVRQRGNLRAFVRWLRLVLGATIVQPLYLYDHGGLSLRTGQFMSDPIGWDMSMAGLVYDTASKREATGCTSGDVKSVLEAEVNTYAQFLIGDIYGYVIEHLTTCNHNHQHATEVESCWGFYGQDQALAEAEDVLASIMTTPKSA